MRGKAYYKVVKAIYYKEEQRFIAFACTAKSCAFAIFLVAFSRQTGKRYFKVFSNYFFKHVWLGSQLLIWYAVCFQAMSFRDRQ